MPPAYFDTRFKLGLPLSELPESFAIITAYATKDETCTVEENQTAKPITQFSKRVDSNV